MADNAEVPDTDEIEETPGYKPPAQKSLKEIAEADQDDEALVKYKKTLLGAEDEVVLSEWGKSEREIFGSLRKTNSRLQIVLFLFLIFVALIFR